MELKKIENEIVSIYENEEKQKLINARELHKALNSKQEFANWIKNRISKYSFLENEDFIRFDNFIKGDKKGYGNKKMIEFYLTMDTAKEISMIENNEAGRRIRKYFIEVEKRYKDIIENPTNILDFMRLAINQIEENGIKIIDMESRIKILEEKSESEIKQIRKQIDVIISKDYCLAADIAEQLKLYSENKLPHSNLIGAIARQLGFKISYKHYYEDENIAIVPDLSKGNNYYQVYYKQTAVDKIIRWFDQNKNNISYKVIYERNIKDARKGKIKEKGYKIENVCYKVFREE